MRIRIIDAFTDRPFAGNPAAVCLLDEPDTWPDETWMQQVAAEMHLSETAFAHPLTDSDDADWALRWFTPEVETDLCGHATLATAHAMHRDRGTPGTVRFMSRSGVLVAHTSADGNITLDFPAAALSETPAPDGLAEALGATPHAAYATGALRDLLVVLDDEAAVHALAPDLGAIARIARRDGLRGVIATASASSPDADYDFVSRFFAPADGIPEDPVTGSAHTGLAPYGDGAKRSAASHGRKRWLKRTRAGVRGVRVPRTCGRALGTPRASARATTSRLTAILLGGAVRGPLPRREGPQTPLA